MENAIQKGIEAAEQDLVKDAEEKLLEEVQIKMFSTQSLQYCSFGFSEQFVWNEAPEIYSFTSSSLYPTTPLCEWAIFLTRVSWGKSH